MLFFSINQISDKRQLLNYSHIFQERQIALVRDLLLNDGGRNLNDETREKLQFLNNTTLNGRHSTFKDHLQEK